MLLAAITLALCLVLTYSRGSWIAIAAGLATVAAVFLRWPELAPRPVLLGLAAACVLLPALLLLPSIVSRISARPDPANAWNLPIDPEREGSAAMRGAVWQGGFAAAAARPFLGWGPGTFREAYDRSKGDTMKRLEAQGGRTADQAHGFYLAAFVERGAPGLAALLLFAPLGLAAGAAIIGSGAPAGARLLAAGLVASVTALLAHALFEDNLALGPHALLLHANVGLLAASAPGPRIARRGGPALGGVGILAALIAMGFGFQSARAEAAATTAARSGVTKAAQLDYAKASRLAPWEDRYALGEAKASEALEEWTSAETAYRRAASLNPSDPVTKHELARLYLAHEDRFGKRGAAQATALLREALAQNPHYAEIRNDLGVALLRAGDKAAAVEAFRLAVEGRLNFVDPLVNLAAIALEDGDRATAETWTRRALERNPDSARALAMASNLGIPGAQ
jgi:Flp pilus assembly protein TadD